MSAVIRTITLDTARRLAVAAQRLSGPLPEPNHLSMLEVVRQIGCLQLDPTSAVARSHTLVLWSRLGKYNPADLDRLLWEDRVLFEYWAHAASIVLTEDYPIHYAQMRQYGKGISLSSQRILKWVQENAALRDHVMAEILEHGPLPSKYFEDKSRESWRSTGWTSNRNVGQMLNALWDSGILMVVGRKSGHRQWDLTERFLPDWTPRDFLEWPEVVHVAAQKSLRALGVARAKDIEQHFTRSRYPGLKDVLDKLEVEGIIQQVKVAGDAKGFASPWYIHSDHLPLLDTLEAGEWNPRTVLLSPFDNLICDRPRTELLFNFDFRLEIYVPKDKRKYGYYVLPILHGDKLIGRIDPLMNRKESVLTVNAVYAELDAPMNKETGRAVAQSVEALAVFLGANSIQYTEKVPKGWKKQLTS